MRLLQVSRAENDLRDSESGKDRCIGKGVLAPNRGLITEDIHHRRLRDFHNSRVNSCTYDRPIVSHDNLAVGADDVN